MVFAPSPITQAIPAILLKWLKKAKLALWVQDLWPESLSATGFVRNPYLLRAVGWMVRAIYRPCDTLLVQSRAFVEPVAQYADRAKIQYYPNSMDVSSSKAVVPVPGELLELLEQHFCVVFAGNLGTAQALDTLVQAAVHLRDEPRIRLVLVGSGQHGTRLFLVFDDGDDLRDQPVEAGIGAIGEAAQIVGDDLPRRQGGEKVLDQGVHFSCVL